MHSQKILIIDDDDAVRALASAALEQEGFQVIMASKGHDGIELFHNEQPDLIILDLMLPDFDGFDICFAVRKESQVPILILSARDEEVDKVVGFRMGADDYVTKPFSSAELALRVKAILKRNRPYDLDSSTHSRVIYGDLVIDLQKREVTVGNRQVNLTTKEFDLLWFLANHPNQVFTREELSSKVWEDYYAGNPGTINVLVCRLRDKIETNPAHPQYIHTVWGVGYKFVAAEAH
jgi:DNA-binding response OmpR family regulator